MEKKKESEERNNREALLLEKKKILRNLVLLLTASFVVLIGTLTMAWFSLNKKTGTGGMRITTSTIPFELKTVGYYGYYDDWLDDEVGKIAESRSEAPEPPSGTSSSITTGSSTTIQWLMTDEDNAKNYVTDDTNEVNIGIRPGSSGSLKFSVVPYDQETIGISFKLKMIPYRTVYRMTGESGSEVYEYDPVTGQRIELEPQLITGTPDAVTYMTSHILFFKKRTGSPGNYVYSELITPDESFELVYVPGEGDEPGTYTENLTFSKVGNELQEKEFTIYWIWPETLAEAVLSGSQQMTGKKPVCGSDNLEIFNELKKDPTKYLKGYNSVNDVAGTANADLTQAIIKRHYSKLSVEYNNADQEIGDDIGYLLLQLTATSN